MNCIFSHNFYISVESKQRSYEFVQTLTASSSEIQTPVSLDLCFFHFDVVIRLLDIRWLDIRFEARVIPLTSSFCNHDDITAAPLIFSYFRLGRYNLHT
jgi:hypothetical protein